MPHSSPAFMYAMIAIVAGATFATRVLPFLIFRHGQSRHEAVRYVGHYLPLMIMVILVVYSFKDVNWHGDTYGAKELIGGATTATLQLTVRNVLLSIAVGTIAYALAGRLL